MLVFLFYFGTYTKAAEAVREWERGPVQSRKGREAGTVERPKRNWPRRNAEGIRGSLQLGSYA